MTGPDAAPRDMPSPRIAVIGSINVDHVAFVDRAPSTGETVHARDALVGPGGKGANQAFVLARLGADAAMFGAVGADANGELALASLRTAGVDVTSVLIADGPTGIAMIAVDASGDNRIIVTGGANLAVTPEYIDDVIDLLDTYDVIVMQLEIPLATVEYAARVLGVRGKTVVLDPGPATPLTDTLLQHVDVLKPNTTELAVLAQGAPAGVEDAARSLVARGAGCVVASLGEEGALVVRGGTESLAVPAESVTVVDTTGAGDSLTAALAYAIGVGAPIDDAVRFGVSVASAVVQTRGTHAAVPPTDRLRRMWVDAGAAIRARP